MSDHKVLDFGQPVNPEDIETGNILLIHGQPRTITKVEPYHEPHNRMEHMRDRRYAHVGQGETVCFYVFACAVCGDRRALAGNQGGEDWYRINHADTVTILCGAECLRRWTLVVLNGSQESFPIEVDKDSGQG